jgi:acyl-coenzyme A synthetase/AMP-(fatty) acid ligase
VPIPTSPELTEREVDVLLDDADPAAMICDESLPLGDPPASVRLIAASAIRDAILSGPAADYADTLANDPAFLIYTSGTTARPKGVLHAHRSAWGRRPMYHGWYGMDASDRVLHAGSFNWTYTLGTGLTDPWANGATAVAFVGEKTPDVWPRLIREHHISLFAAVPGVYRQMLKYARVDAGALGRLRHGLCAGETLPEDTLADWRARTGKPLFEALGMSELSTYISTGPDTRPKPGTVGRAQPGRCVAILAEDDGCEPLPPDSPGLIAAHSTDPGLMLGYWRRPREEEQVFRGDWFIGGDAGAIDEQGYVTHLGRRNELMNAGGFRVSPVEVEQELARHPLVAEVAVAEVEVRPGTAVIAAFIVAREGLAADAAALRAHAETCLAGYKQPREYIFVDELPRTANAKVKRADLQRVFANTGKQGR